MSSFVHSTAVVDPGACLGEGAEVWHFAHVSAGAQVGPGVVLGQNVYVGPGVPIGARSRVQNNVSLFSGVEIGEDVFLGPSCVFTNVLQPRAHVSRKGRFLVTRVGRGATVGANATVLCGHAVGEFAFIGAGAVVLSDVPDHALVVGNPARTIGFVCRCGERLRNPACPGCGLHYRWEGGRCRLA